MLSNILKKFNNNLPKGPNAWIYNIDALATRKTFIHHLFEAPLTLMIRYGDIYKHPCPGKVYMIANPDAIKIICKDRLYNYPKSSKIWKKIRLFLGNSILSTDKDNWHKHRKVVQKSFTKQQLASYTQSMEQEISQWLNNISHRFANKKTMVIDIKQQMVTIGQRIIFKTLLNHTLTQKELKLTSEIVDFSFHRLSRHLGISKWPWFPTIENFKFHYLNKKYNKLLNTLLQKSSLPGLTTLPQTQAIDEIRSLIVAGFETTASVLPWIWYNLSRHPEFQQDLQNELQSVLGNNLPTVADLPQLPFCKAIVQETLRLYPAIPILSRIAQDEDTLLRFTIPKASNIFIHVYATQRHPDYWEQPNVFNPYRFFNQKELPHPFAYLPFGAGPRMCVGSQFAMMEIPLILASFSQRFLLKIKPTNNKKAKPDYGVSLRIAKLKMMFEKTNTSISQ